VVPSVNIETFVRSHNPIEDAFDFRNIIGQDHAKRALLLAAAGGHNILLEGPPGS
jgi:magnesium chelatase family protein